MDLNFVFHQNYISKSISEELRFELPSSKVLDDVQLWQEFQAGSEPAFSKIYGLHVAMLYSYGMKLIKDKELIKDCIQDLFIEIWNTKHRLGLVKNIKSYLFKSIRRKLIAEAIKNRENLDHSINFPNLKIISTPSEEWRLIENQTKNEKQIKLKEALDHLTQRQREIIHLKFFAGFSYSEISETMDISMKGTYKLMGRSINFLRTHMSNIAIE